MGETKSTPKSQHPVPEIDETGMPRDWNAVWMERQRRSSAAGRGGGCPSAWESRKAAEKYWANASQSFHLALRLSDLRAVCTPASRLLDIGAGPGTLAVPLAAHVAHITAIEPAAGMADVLRDNLAQYGLSNVQVVQKRMDDVDLETDLKPPYDLAVAAYSMGMLDLRKTILDILRVTRGHVFIFWHAGEQQWDREANILWPLLHGRSHYPIPKADIIFNLLYQMGIYPNIQVMRSERVLRYPDFEHLVQDYSDRYDVECESQRDLLRQFLAHRFTEEEGLVVTRATHTGLKIGWHTQDVPADLLGS